jgi:hypothetical protein
MEAESVVSRHGLLAFLHWDPDEEDTWVSKELILLVAFVVGICVVFPSVCCSGNRTKTKAD